MGEDDDDDEEEVDDDRDEDDEEEEEDEDEDEGCAEEELPGGAAMTPVTGTDDSGAVATSAAAVSGRVSVMSGDACVKLARGAD